MSEQVKTFRVGLNKVLVDNVLSNIMLGADHFISTRNVNEEQKSQLENAYLNIMKRIESGDGTLYLNDEGYLVDTTGQLKDEGDFKAYGIMAGYMIPRIKNADKYDDPNDLKDFSIKLFGKDLLNDLSGGNENNLSLFIQTDPFNEETLSRGLSERIRLLNESLDKVHSEGTKKYKNYDNQNSINRIKEILNNGVTENEYFELAKLTGIENIGNLFYTGKLENPQEEQEELKTPYKLFEEWMRETNPYEITTPLYDSSVKFDYNTLTGNFNVEDYANAIYDPTVTNDDLLGWVNRYVNGELELFGPSMKFILSRLKLSGLLVDIQNNQYIIPGIQTNNKGTVFVWDSKNNTLKETLKHNLSYFQQQYIKDYLNNVLNTSGVDPNIYNSYAQYFTSYKQGGILKALKGIQIPNWFNNLYTQKVLTGWDTNKDNSSWTQSKGVHGTAGNLDDVYKYNDLYTKSNIIASDIQSYLNSGNYSDINLFITAYNEDAEKIRNFWTSDKTYNQRGVASHNNLFKKLFKSRSELLDNNESFYLGWDEKLKDIMGSTTWLRRMDRYEKEYDLLNDEEKKSRTHTIKLGDSEYQIYKKANGDIALINNTSPSSETEIDTGTSPLTVLTGKESETVTKPELYKPVTDWKLPNLEAPKENNKALNTSLLSGTGRLLMSLGYNNSINKDLKDSVPLSLKNPYELYSPVTGAFGEMNQLRLQAAAMRNRAKFLYTVDPEKNALTALEYNKIANDLEHKGFIADNREIQRTMSEARTRNDKNIALRATIADYNRQLIEEFNEKLNKIEASKKYKDWNSFNTFLKDVEALFVNKYNTKYLLDEEEREKKNVAWLDASNKSALSDYNNWIKQANDWKTTRGSQFNDVDRSIYNSYLAKAKDLYKSRLLANEYSALGIDWTPPSSLDLNEYLDWNEWYKKYATQ